MAWWNLGRRRRNTEESERSAVQDTSSDIDKRRDDAVRLLHVSQNALGEVEQREPRVQEVHRSLKKIKRDNHFAALMRQAMRGS
jgi:hypothetical protein